MSDDEKLPDIQPVDPNDGPAEEVMRDRSPEINKIIKKRKKSVEENVLSEEQLEALKKARTAKRNKNQTHQEMLKEKEKLIEEHQRVTKGFLDNHAIIVKLNANIEKLSDDFDILKSKLDKKVRIPEIPKVSAQKYKQLPYHYQNNDDDYLRF